MNYSLGNMLGGSNGSLNPDKLSLNLQFATDKTLTARKGPTPVFTRASTATFVGSNGLIQSASINAARFDHDPITLACKGLLIEESRTNSLQHSANFKNTTSSYWENLSATTITVDQTTSPDGGVNADLLATSTTAFDCYTRRNNSYVGSTQYTYSIFLKQGPSNHRYVGLYIGAGISSVQFPFFDFNNPTVVQIPSGTMVGTINSTRVDAYPSGWYRVSVTFTTAATPVNLHSGVYISTSNGTLASSSTAGLNAYIWGIQLELGAFPTSYIPTTTASVVRSADICSITGANFTSFYNQSEGTVYTESRPATVNGTTTTFSLSNGTANERWLTRFAQNEQVVITSAGVEANLDALNPIAGTLYKVATAAKLNDIAMSINGLAVLTDTSQPMPNADRAGIGNATGAVAGGGAVTIASIRYYKKRLPNAKIVTLTT